MGFYWGYYGGTNGIIVGLYWKIKGTCQFNMKLWDFNGEYNPCTVVGLVSLVMSMASSDYGIFMRL